MSASRLAAPAWQSEEALMRNSLDTFERRIRRMLEVSMKENPFEENFGVRFELSFTPREEMKVYIVAGLDGHVGGGYGHTTYWMRRKESAGAEGKG